MLLFFFSSRRRHTRFDCDWSSDVCSSDLGEGKVDANLTNFLSTDAAGWHPNSPPRPGGAPHPAPSARKSATQTAQKTALCAPCEHPGGSESENRPATRGTAHSEVQGDARGTARCTTRPMPPFTFCCPQAIIDEEA